MGGCNIPAAIGVDVGAGSSRFCGRERRSLSAFVQTGLCSPSGGTGLPEAAVQALHKAVLHLLSGRDVVLPLDGMVLLPMQDRPGGQVGAFCR